MDAKSAARVTRLAIHPAIGIARVGNAPEEYFLAPEAPGVVPDPEKDVPGRQPGWRRGFKDHEGRVKRQACRFRIYGFDDAGKVVGEITAADAEISWEVQLAARKASWYQFENAMDLGDHAKCSTRRNDHYPRKTLAITPRAKRISGRSQNAGGGDRKYRIDGRIAGKFRAVLGELRTDDEGRLVVLAGPGDAKSFAGPDNPITTFANNEGWYDDIADGPVRARVKLRGSRRVHDCEPAMVATTPPNYGPGLLGVVTMYDVVLDLFYREPINGKPPLPRPERPSFTNHIYPILERIVQTQWVNQGFYMAFGANGSGDFTTPERLRRLSRVGSSAKDKTKNRRARRAVFGWFRDPNSTKPRPALVPPFYGDAFGDFSGLPNDELAVTETQYGWLRQWAKGDFVEDWKGPQRPRPLDRLPLQRVPHALDKAHLEDVLGGPFHPGIEITWTLRRASMWKEPFRLNVLPRGEQPSDDYGPILTPAACLGPDGPLTSNGPGSLTRWMGVPWQTDSASCLSGYDASYYLPLPSFWAARIPNEVLSRFGYDRSANRKLRSVERLRHFDYRQYWLRDLKPNGNDRRQDMVENWWRLGIVVPVRASGHAATLGLPAMQWVETGRDAKFSSNDPTRRLLRRAEDRVGPAMDGAGTARSHAAQAKAAPPAGEDARTVHIAERRRRYGRGDR